MNFSEQYISLGIQDHGKDFYRSMSCLIDVLYKRKINVSFTVTRLTKADTRRISTAPPPTVTNPSITTDLSPLTPQSPLDLLQATPTDKQFVLRGGVNITALRLYLLTGYPPRECPQTDPRMPPGPMVVNIVMIQIKFQQLQIATKSSYQTLCLSYDRTAMILDLV